MQKRLPFLTMLILLIAGISCGRMSQPTGPVENTPKVVEKNLSAFRPIQGTEYMIADISGSPSSAERDFSPFSWIERGYSGYAGYAVYNYVFFNSETETFNRLVPTNEYVVLQIMGFPTGASTAEPEDFEPVQWWSYLLVKDDTDKDGVLDYKDNLTLGVTDVGGNAPTELILEIDHVLGQTLKDHNTLFIMYHLLEKNYVAKIDLPGRQIVSTTEIDLGDDVK